MSWLLIFRVGQLAHVFGTCIRSHGPMRVAASEPVPENRLPGCQCNTKLLKYLNIRSLRRLPCNYTCSFYIPLSMGVHAPACTGIDLQCVWVYICFTHPSALSHTILMCICRCVYDLPYVCLRVCVFL